MADNQNLPPRPKRIPPHILRRRRIVAVIILVVVLGLIGWGIWALVGLFLSDETDGEPEPEPTVTDTVSPSPTETEVQDDDTDEDADDEAQAAEDACDPEVLALDGSTDQEVYAEDEVPMLEMTITHAGEELCDAALGSDLQNFVIQDADGDFVFSTRACQVDPQSQIVEMEPGQSESVDFQWERIGTDEDCETVVEDVEAGQYQLVVGLDDQTAEPVVFELE